jgi:predicted nuclease of restriction endonuclease-like (RecB) superfamily
MTSRSSRPAVPRAPTGDRHARGRAHEEAPFLVSPPATELPTNYGMLLDALKRQIRETRLRTVLSANAAMTLAYWQMGHEILQRQDAEGWGTKVIDRLSADLRHAFPDMRGLSARNLKYMRAFAAAWPDQAIVQEVLAQIPWYHNLALLEQLAAPEPRLWYAHQTLAHGWSHAVLRMHIQSNLYDRRGKTVNNFTAVLPPSESDLAAQVFQDPYLFDFLGTADPRKERELEQALVDHIQRFLLALGAGFAFVGQQVPLEVGGQDFRIDLLFYHLKLRRYVVIELKAGAFEPGFVGQMNLYLSVVDDLLRHNDDKPTIGLLLCREKDQLVVEYALRGFAQPIGVADWETQIVTSLPSELTNSLPSVTELEAELGHITSAVGIEGSRMTHLIRPCQEGTFSARFLRERLFTSVRAARSFRGGLSVFCRRSLHPRRRSRNPRTRSLHSEYRSLQPRTRSLKIEMRSVKTVMRSLETGIALLHGR